VTENDEYHHEGESQRDVEIIRAYGARHPDAWVEVWGERDPEVNLVASFFDDDVSEYERQLRQLVSRPDRLQVRRSPWPLAHLVSIRQEIHDRAMAARPRSTVQMLSIVMGIVKVTLAPDQEDFAARLTQDYGDAVDIMVGRFHFPDGGPDPIYSRLTGSALTRPAPVISVAPELPSYLHVTLEGEARVVSGQTARAALRVRNTGPDDVVLTTNGMVTASVVDPVTRQVVGGFHGAQSAPLVTFSLVAAGTVTVPMLIGTTSSKPELGYAVPPGAWALVVTLHFEGVGSRSTPPLALTITPRETTD